MTFEIETEIERDGRWIADIPAIPGAMVYGVTEDDAIQQVQALALEILALHDETG